MESGNATDALLLAPGPSPWYLRNDLAEIKTPRDKFVWHFDSGASRSGLTRLLTSGGRAVLILDFNCYVQVLPNGKLLIWHEVRRSIAAENPGVVFLMLDLEALVPIEDPDAVSADLRHQKRSLHFEGGNPCRFHFITTIEEGTHTFAAPREFAGLAEQLVLADYGPSESGSNNWDKMFRAIFAFDFCINTCTVLPQRWFNNGSYDFGYQWITRVAREVPSGKIVGEGIRLGFFILDNSGTTVEEWLKQDPFFHPERPPA